MRTWAKATIGGIAVIALAFAALGGTGAYFVMRHMETRTASESDALQAIDEVKARFKPRPPLIDIANPRTADIRINRAIDASATPVTTIHVINWKSETGEVSRAEIPVWLMRFSSVNILSQLGVAPARFRLTVTDVQRYGPGILVDYASPGVSRTFVWVE